MLLASKPWLPSVEVPGPALVLQPEPWLPSMAALTSQPGYSRLSVDAVAPEPGPAQSLRGAKSWIDVPPGLTVTSLLAWYP